MGIPSSKIGIVGGHGAVARQLRAAHLPNAVAFVRKAPGANDKAVSQYQAITARDLAGLHVVINCAGLIAGSEQDLRRANLDLPARLAAVCQQAGVKRLVHISSFSVYGFAPRIDATTAPAPKSAYGRSKLDGDTVLLEHAAAGQLQAIVVRLPAIIDPERRSGKMARLLAAWRKAGIFPVPAGDLRRSMISSAMASRVLHDVAVEGGPAVMLAADPQPFRYVQAAAAMQAASGRRVRMLRVPAALAKPLRRLAPGVAASLLDDSLLDPASNFAARYSSDLYDAIGAMAVPLPKAASVRPRD